MSVSGLFNLFSLAYVQNINQGPFSWQEKKSLPGSLNILVQPSPPSAAVSVITGEELLDEILEGAPRSSAFSVQFKSISWGERAVLTHCSLSEEYRRK